MKRIFLGAAALLLATEASAFDESTVKAVHSWPVVKDHYKTVIDRTPYEVEVCTAVETNKGPTIGGLDVQGAIIGGIIGNQIGDMKGNGAAGALIGGLLGGEKTPTNKCVIETRYNETSKNVYSHSTVTFSANGRDYSVRFIK